MLLINAQETFGRDVQSIGDDGAVARHRLAFIARAEAAIEGAEGPMRVAAAAGEETMPEAGINSTLLGIAASDCEAHTTPCR